MTREEFESLLEEAFIEGYNSVIEEIEEEVYDESKFDLEEEMDAYSEANDDTKFDKFRKALVKGLDAPAKELGVSNKTRKEIGKTALAKGLAYRVQNGDVPNALKNLRIISIDSATLVAGTKYVGTLEEKMKNILEEASSSKDIIIFMDEIHQALGAGKAEGDPNSVSEILKPYLDYGRVRIIGATTTEEYNEFVSKDDAFKTRFKRINISEPDDHIVYEVLDDLIESYNHLSEKSSYSCPKLNLNIEERDMIIKWLIDSTRPNFRSYNDRASNPRLVLDIIKEAYAIASLNNQDEVTMVDLKEAILLEERLYLSSRKRQVQRLDEIKPSYKKDNVIPFRLILKK